MVCSDYSLLPQPYFLKGEYQFYVQFYQNEQDIQIVYYFLIFYILIQL
jgi:hypothetical protein